jgi:8-oxo-dGTP pyrophosphatase MutT (NUDIX family)
MSKGAGILFVSMNGNALFLKRSDAALDCAGCWDFPGGGQEGDETADQTAIRECREEIGFVPEGARIFHTRTASPLAGDGKTVGIGSAGSFPVLTPAGPTAIEVPPSDVAMPPDVDFTTFLQRVTNEFTPELNGEHTGFAWAPLDSPPEPLHPGCRIALDRLKMNELGVARAIAEGRLTSPQKYENVWLFAIRITGTDVAYRPRHEEFVHRSADYWLTPEGVARCNGLPVIFKHPTDAPLLTGEEFRKRIVGTVFLPYVAGDELWAIAKIYVDAAAELLGEGELSTSPGVNFANFSVNVALRLENGSKVLVEGDPSLFDHIAICELGVWDKGGEPSGVRAESREDSMTEDEKKAAEDKAKKDAAEKEEKEKKEREDKAKRDAAAEEEKKRQDAAGSAGEKLDKVLSHLDSVNGKMDAFGKRLDAVEEEKKRGDAAKRDADEKEKAEKEAGEKAAADKAKKDADEKEAEEKRKREDAAKNDSAALRAELDSVKRMIPKAVGDADYIAMTAAQQRADDVYSMFGGMAPRPMAGETPQMYERRTVRDLVKHSTKWNGVDVTTAFADDAAFERVRNDVYEDAKVAAMSPATAPEGGLRYISQRTGTGHTINTPVGSSRAWMDRFSGQARHYAQGRFDDSSVRH